MGKVFLIVGGRRSGKSDFGLRLGESLRGPHAFIATCPSIDIEMDERIAKHKQSRDGTIWSTIEEHTDLAGIIRDNGRYGLFLIDCVTLWINNLMFVSEQKGFTFSESELILETNELLHVCHNSKADVIFVSSEVGLGVVPDNPQTRAFLDLTGRCNQILSAGSEEVFMVSCGIPIRLKKGNSI